MEVQFKVDLLEENDIQRFVIVGEIDAFTAPVLTERLSSAQNEVGMQAELDLSEVSYMDSTGLGVFVGFYKAVKANGGHVKITGLNKRLSRLFEITGLNDVMDIEIKKGGASDASL